ncbi:hypothetical protein OIU85_002530 [Salix viminalis]|uniref:Methyltransferase type 11 domain-containing protein n=1 Tax=Salix viminalis TaxID=40686 RepID=A0A9Q0ZYZ1_SALVM|nr:hypothetical protein OIU85_002530 [Salix viminalis]
MANITFSHISSYSLLRFVNPFPPLLPTNLSISRHLFPLHPHQLHRWWQCSTFCCWIHRLCDSTVCCLFVFAAGNFFYSAVGLHYEMAQRIVSCVNDWSTVKVALDIGCGRGILLNAVATQLKKTGSSGRVVGLDRSKRTTLSTLRTANMEGVGEYVTCREGDVRSLPFGDNYFDVVVSATFVHTVGKEYGHRTVEAAAERMRVLGEMVRVLKPCGVGVLWDLLHACGICPADSKN